MPSGIGEAYALLRLELPGHGAVQLPEEPAAGERHARMGALVEWFAQARGGVTPRSTRLPS